MSASAERAGPAATSVAALTALGIVYGDLGTSPLYTMQTVVGAMGPHHTAESALGALSLIFWTLVITISVKYCLFVMRADNHGEGGILALMSLVGMNDWRRGTYIGAAMGLLGAALIYGDGVITPSISVLSARRGAQRRHDAAQALRARDRRGHPGGPVHRPALRNGEDRQDLRPDHADLVLRDRPAGPGRRDPPSGRAGGGEPRLWRAAAGARRGLRDRDPRRGLPLRHRRRGALRRHGPHRPLPDPPRLVPRRAAEPAAQLCGPDGASDRGRRAAGRQSLLPAGPALGRAAAGAARDDRHHHRQPGDHHRLLLHDPPGHAARLDARPSTSARPRTGSTARSTSRR